MSRRSEPRSPGQIQFYDKFIPDHPDSHQQQPPNVKLIVRVLCFIYYNFFDILRLVISLEN